jgi:hypothetical protein
MLMTNCSNLSSESIANFISGLGLLAKNKKIEPKLNVSIINVLLMSLANLPLIKLDSKAIAKSLYGLSLLARADYLNDFKPDSVIFTILVDILLYKPQNEINKKSTLTTLYAIIILAEHGYLNKTDGLRLLKSINNTKETALLPNANHRNSHEHIPLFSYNKLFSSNSIVEFCDSHTFSTQRLNY